MSRWLVSSLALLFSFKVIQAITLGAEINTAVFSVRLTES